MILVTFDTDGTLIPTTGCSASSEYSNSYSCYMALDGDLTTDFATNKEGAGAWIEVGDFIQSIQGKSFGRDS